MGRDERKKRGFPAARLLAVLLACLAVLPPQAFAAEESSADMRTGEEPAKAEYLVAGLTANVSGMSHRRSLIEEVLSEAAPDGSGTAVSDAAEAAGSDAAEAVSAAADAGTADFGDYGSIIRSADPDTAFSFLLEAGRKRELVYAGTFADTPDVSAQYTFLTETNGFMHFPSSECGYFGGYSFDTAEGDIIFWNDEDGSIINAGLVCACHRSYDEVAVCSGGRVRMIVLSAETAPFFGEFTAVRPVYSSNEHLVYLFCRKEMGYTRTGACGMLANIDRESYFRTGVEEVDTGEGFGICQWSFGRRSGLVNWCKRNGCSYKSLDGQLRYLRHEMETDFVPTDLLLKTIEENSTGAYDAGYWVCFEYEQPYDFEFVSDDRACRSRDSYWPYYSGIYA